jgi:hypothetical protein
MTENKKPNGSDEDEFLFVQAPQNVQALYEAIAKKYVKYAADCISDITPQTGDFAVFRCAVAGLKVEKGRLTDFGKATLEGPLSAKDIAAERKMCPSLNMYTSPLRSTALRRVELLVSSVCGIRKSKNLPVRDKVGGSSS